MKGSKKNGKVRKVFHNDSQRIFALKRLETPLFPPSPFLSSTNNLNNNNNYNINNNNNNNNNNNSITNLIGLSWIKSSIETINNTSSSISSTISTSLSLSTNSSGENNNNNIKKNFLSKFRFREPFLLSSLSHPSIVSLNSFAISSVCFLIYFIAD